MKQKLIIIVGPTGSGKTTIGQYLKQTYHIQPVITHTTRPKRVNEVDGVDYYFETADSLAQKHLIETVNYAGYQYGSSYEALKAAWQKSDLISIVLEINGALTYLEALGQQVQIIYLKVSPQQLKKRLYQRQDDPQAISQRLNSEEFKRDLVLPESLQSVAYQIENDSFEVAKKLIANLIKEIKQKA